MRQSVRQITARAHAICQTHYTDCRKCSNDGKLSFAALSDAKMRLAASNRRLWYDEWSLRLRAIGALPHKGMICVKYERRHVTMCVQSKNLPLQDIS